MSEAAVRRRESPVAAEVVSVGFDDVYRRESVAMVRLAVLLVGRQQQAEEIVQDAFAQLFERCAQTGCEGVPRSRGGRWEARRPL